MSRGSAPYLQARLPLEPRRPQPAVGSVQGGTPMSHSTPFRLASQRKLLSLVAALIGMITPFAASAAPPGGPNPAQLLTGLEGGSGSTVGPGGALYVTEGAAGRDLARRSEDRGHHDVRQWPAEVDRGHRGGDGRRVHRQHRIRTGHPHRPRRRRPRHRRHLPGGRPRQLHRRRGHRRVLSEQSAEHSVRHPNRTPVRAGNLPWRVPGHRWAPQPRYCGSLETARSPS